MIVAHRYHALQSGPHLLVLGGVHGDEICGSLATADLCGRLDRGDIQLKQGSLTVIPVCNPQAHRLGQRQAEVNLNRVFQRHAAPTMYEHHLANLLVPYIKACDYLLDLHSYSVEGGEPFVFQDYETKAQGDFAHMMGIPTIVTGWPEIYGPLSAQEYQGDSVACARAYDKVGVVVECGQHQDPQSPLVAFACILRALAGLGLCDQEAAGPRPLAPPRRIRACQMVRKEKEGKLARPWKNFETVRAGEVIAHYDDGEALTAAYDGVVILPKASAQIGQEWYYCGKYTD